MARTQPGASGRKKAVPGARSAGGPTRRASSPPEAPKPPEKAAPKPASRPAPKPAVRPSTRRVAAKTTTVSMVEPVPSPPPSGPGPVERYQLALAAYTDCLRILQERNWVKAAAAFAAFIAQHGRERELADRARMYLNVCEQHIGSDGDAPKTFDERYAAAVILANRGEFDAALRLLDAALAERPDSDKALYLKASTLAQQGQRRFALDLLTRAIARDERNRVYAVNDPDFGSLRDDEEFITLTTREDEREA